MDADGTNQTQLDHYGECPTCRITGSGAGFCGYCDGDRSSPSESLEIRSPELAT